MIWPVETGETRRLLGITQRLVALFAHGTETLGQSAALVNSREPPALAFPGRKAQKDEISPCLGIRGKAAPSSASFRRLLTPGF
jgi:hypothetical protein